MYMYYKLGQACVTNWGDCCYKLGSYYKLGQPSLQNRATITNCAKFITNWDRYYKSGQLLQIGA